MKVVVAAHRHAELNALVSEIVEAGGSTVALAGDVKGEAYVQALVDTALSKAWRVR